MERRRAPALVSDRISARERERTLKRLAAKAEQFAASAQAPNTRRAYASALRMFESYCCKNRLACMPSAPQTYVLYLTHLSELGRKMSTIRVHAAAIRDAHVRVGLRSPGDDTFAKRFMDGLENEIGEPPVKKDALTFDLLLLAAESMPRKTLRDKRDRAILLLGFALSARRSEIAAINVGDLTFERKGLVVKTRKSKTDRKGKGHDRGVPRLANPDLCAVRAVKAWMTAAGITRGALFRTFSMKNDLQSNRIDPYDVARAVQRVTGKTLEGDFAAHSLRSGYITSAARAGIGVPEIMHHTNHKSMDTVLGYVHRAKVLDDPSLTKIERASEAESEEAEKQPRRRH